VQRSHSLIGIASHTLTCEASTKSLFERQPHA
jgi:hypothetical protein